MTARARERGALERYLDFVRSRQQHPVLNFFGQPSDEPAVKWPRWRLSKASHSLLHPTAKNIRVALIEYHKIHRPALLGDIVGCRPTAPSASCCARGAMARSGSPAPPHPPSPPLTSPV